MIDKAHVPPTEHVFRMLVERYQLAERLNKLQAFVSDNPVYHTLDTEERRDMQDQLLYMKGYLKVLEGRIRRADPEGILA